MAGPPALPRAEGHRAWPDRVFRAVSSAVEHYLDMVGVTGSNPVPPTTRCVDSLTPLYFWFFSQLRERRTADPADLLMSTATNWGRPWATGIVLPSSVAGWGIGSRIGGMSGVESVAGWCWS